MTKTFEICANGTFMGEYDGVDEDTAVDCYARDAGYKNFSELLAEVPGSSRDELQVSEINVDKLVADVTEEAGEVVFQDSFGDGVAMVKGKSYATYRGMAEAYGFVIDDYHA